MYKLILTVRIEGRTALREGALLARQCGAILQQPRSADCVGYGRLTSGCQIPACESVRNSP